MRVDRKINYMLNQMINKINLVRQKVIIQGKVTINGRIKICSSGVCELGNNVVINSGRNYNVIGGDTRTNFIIMGGGRIIIGEGVGISNSTIISMNQVIIENNVKIGGSCKIYDTDFHSLRYKDRISDDSNIQSRPIKIKNGAFIGAHSIILKGVTIGEKSIIGAGSVVTKSVPDGEIWGGNPAKFLKKIDK